jgi:hypothetical protein
LTAKSNPEAAKLFFEKYIKLCRTYDKSLVSLYSDNAVIKRVLINSDGKIKAIILPTKEYKKKLLFYRLAAKMINYKNIYQNLKYLEEKNNLKIEGQRMPSGTNYFLPFYMVIQKDKSGNFVIIEEMVYTKSIFFFKD